MDIHIGTAIGQYGSFPFSINGDRHACIVAESGTGKSILMTDMTVRDIRAGRGVIFIDPHGSAVERIGEMIPKDRFEDVIWFDPTSDKPIGLPVLKARTRDQKIKKADQFINTTSKIYGEGSFLGNSAYITRNILYAIMEVEDDPNPAHLFKGLTSEGYRDNIFGQVTDENLRTFKRKFDEEWKDQQREQNAAAPTNKSDTYISNYIVRDIICQTDGLSIEDAMASNKIILVDLSKGRLGPIASSFIGSMLMQEVLFAGLTRAKGADTYKVYVDEFHNFVAMDTADYILSEMRKYGLVLVPADQERKTIPTANFITKIAGRVDVESAVTLGKELGVEAETLRTLPNYNWYIKSDKANTYRVEGAKPLTKLGNEYPLWKVKRHTYENYGQPREQVENDINNFLAS